MSIKSDVIELENIRQEFKNLNLKRKKLKEREKIIENKISEYLKSKDQPGVKHQNTAIVLEIKEKPGPKKPKERDTDAMSVLEKYGIQDTQKVWEELMQARKGEMILKETLRFKKIKKSDK